MSLKKIKSQSDYDEALQELERIMDLDPEPDTDAGNRLEVLAMLIKSYDDEHFHFDIPDPIDAIKFIMEQRNLRQTDLVPYIGSPSKVSEVLSRKRPLSLAMIRKLHSGLNIPAEVLLRKQEASLPDDMGIEWRRFPLSNLRKRGWFEEFEGTAQDLKEYAEDLIRPKIQFLREHCAMPVFQRSPIENLRCDKESDVYNIIAWQTRVVEKAVMNPLKVSYKSKINRSFLDHISRFTVLDDGPKLARELLNKNGIHLIIEKHFDRTYLDGAVMLLNDGTPVIGLTLRYDRLDNFWFSLLHELAHLAKHLSKSENVYFDDFDFKDRSKLKEVEAEADDLATESLLPRKQWSETQSEYYGSKGSYDKIKSLANKLNIHVAVLAGRIQYESGNFSRFRRLLGNGIPRQLFSEEYRS